jgi:hypothetical protein
MNQLAKYLLTVGYVLVVLGCIRVNAGEPSGFVEGRLKIISLKEVDLGAADEKSPAMARKTAVRRYAQYPLLILSEDGKKTIVMTADRAGHYRLALPPGDYILDAKGRMPGRVRAKPKPFTVVSNRTVQVDMDIDTGVR